MNGSSSPVGSYVNISADLDWETLSKTGATSPAATPEAIPSAESAPAYVSASALAVDSQADLSLALEAVSTASGDFILTVVTTSGEFTFFLSQGKEFSYAVLSDSSYAVTYSEAAQIEQMISALFNPDEIVDVLFTVD